VLRARALIIQASSPIKIALARESLWRKSALINEINHAYFSPITPLVKSDGDVIQEASRRRHGSIGRCANSQRLMKTAFSGEENRKKTLRLFDEKRLRRSNCRVRPAGRDLLSKIAAVLKGQKE
jgi:hypothetical protein